MPESYNLKSLRLSKIKKKKHIPPCISEDSPRYPWGLEISLNTEALKKLGESTDDFTVKDTVYILAKAKVTQVRVNEQERGKDENVGLQITDMKFQRMDKKDNPSKKKY